MVTNKIKQHILNKEFKLKDFNNSFNKYSNYKKAQVTEFFKENRAVIENYLDEGLFSNVLHILEFGFNEFNWLNLFKKPLTKKMVNQVTKIINDITYEQNKSFIIQLDNLNNNEIRSYAIILYLRYYNKINQIMKKVLTEYLKDYDKKTIVKNLN